MLFVLVGIFQTIYHFRNATGRNRMSVADIVDSREEPDPLHPQQRPYSLYFFRERRGETT
jgi:hypothetical protein